MKHFLAFDLGASSGRAIIGTLDAGKLELKEVHRFANGPVQKGNSIYWDFPQLVNELKEGLRKALEVTPDIAGIGIDTWGVDYVFFDNKTREAKRWPYNYRDDRTSKADTDVWVKISKDELYKETGIQCMPFNTVYQLAAHYREFPEDFKDSTFLMIPDALGLALGGDFSSEYTDCSTTNLLDPESRRWNWKVTDAIGLPREVFPPIVEPCTFGGTLGGELQKELGCGPIPIIKVGSHDTASAVAAVPAPEEGNWAYISAGTWALLGAEIPAPAISETIAENSFTNEGGLNNTIRFLTNIMGSWLFQESRRVWNEAGRNLSFSDIEDMAKSCEPCKYLINPNHSMLLPPGDMPGRIVELCRTTGQGGDLSDGEIARAIYDSLALYFCNKLHTLEKLLHVKYDCLNIVGGGTKAALLMQLTADALNIPVITGPVEATATGNLLAQAIACGEIADLAEARKVVKNSAELKRYEPNAEMHARFMEKMEFFNKITAN
ncbi:MAG: rhamnulokinase [Lentisphaeria bacterium]|nr:rhamnulokinase [Lentisphaeria bacterium]